MKYTDNDKNFTHYADLALDFFVFIRDNSKNWETCFILITCNFNVFMLGFTYIHFFPFQIPKKEDLFVCASDEREAKMRPISVSFRK